MILYVLLLLHSVYGSTHWRRNEGQLHHQASLTLLERTVYELQEELRKREKKDDPMIEEKLMRTDEDCKMAQADLKTSYFASEYPAALFPEFEEHVSLEAQAHAPWVADKSCHNDEIPNCKALYNLEFSPYSFEHLEGMQNRRDLSMSPSKENFIRITQLIFYSNLVSNVDTIKELDSIQARECFLHTNMNHQNQAVREMVSLHYFAVLHWMHLGNAPYAMECMRTLLHYSSTHHLMHHSNVNWWPMVLSLFGNLLSLTQQYEDASTVLELARLHSTSYAQLIVTSSALGDSYALSANFSRAIPLYSEAYELLMKSHDTSNKVGHTFRLREDEIRRKRASLLCNTKIRSELEAQYVNLQEYLRDGEKYHSGSVRNEKNMKLLKTRIANKSTVGEDNLIYDQLMYGYNPYRNCMIVTEGRLKLAQLRCSVTNIKDYDASISKLRERTIKNVNQKPNGTVWKQLGLFTRDRSYPRRLEKFSGTEMDEGHIPPKYPLSPSLLSSVDFFWRRIDWPSSNDCDALLFHSDFFSIDGIPQMFINPEEKGFIVSEILTKMLSLDIDGEHPFPWEEPICTETILPTRLTQLRGINLTLALSRSDRWKEEELSGILVRLAERRMSEAEMGQRIKTLMQYNIGPSWISRNLAALYWRVVGHPSRAITCLLAALQHSDSHRDVALFQLAGILLRTTTLRRDVIVLLSLAVNAAPEQPQGHYLLGRVYILINEIDKGIGSLKGALDRNPFHYTTHNDLLTLVCRGQPSKPGVRLRFPSICCSPSNQEAVCVKTSTGDHCFGMSMDGDGLSKNSLVYTRCNRQYTGFSYKPPPLLSILSPFLPIFNGVGKREESYLMDECEGVQLIHSEEIPLDYGGPEAYISYTPHEWYKSAKRSLVYAIEEEEEDEIEMEIQYNQPLIPHKPLSLLWISSKSEMLRYDIALPEIMPTPSLSLIRTGLSRFPPPRTSGVMCSGVPKLEYLLDTQVSTFLSVSAKGADVEKYIDVLSTLPRGLSSLSPDCPNPPFNPLMTLDHLPFSALSDQFLFYKPEKALTEHLLKIGRKETVEGMGARLGQAIRAASMGGDQSEMWLPAVVSALYWRVAGDSEKAVECLRLALATSPPNMRDVALVSLANVCHQAGLLHSALITAGAALDLSPSIVSIHFTIANIYSSMGDFERALNFYYSTIALQSTFEPAKERVRAIYCFHEGEKYNRHVLI
ncbi:ttc-17 [Pristionchus pacificus]|uniref:Anaphase-promoting complex subunit 3 protein n=1 Tax=Pristionchus pacificus TaxID=54126 RepID=A0A2A6BWL1_PRIPA|nr:ttc-17 [Pristionchus pacificus]|eukprot:PDM70226.1 Anaphase-promoting complex subunit 3 protein [Pristionchus pacificus]